MNLKVRVKNWSFWVSVLLAIVTPVGVYYGVSGADVTSWGALWGLIKQAISNPYVILTVAASVYNALIDPTTSGVTDSARAMTYTTPGGKDCE
jgi:phi LC3 family holin|nr:MAG TPA: holin [Caudoviricetes sp.]